MCLCYQADVIWRKPCKNRFYGLVSACEQNLGSQKRIGKLKTVSSPGSALGNDYGRTLHSTLPFFEYLYLNRGTVLQWILKIMISKIMPSASCWVVDQETMSFNGRLIFCSRPLVLLSSVSALAPLVRWRTKSNCRWRFCCVNLTCPAVYPERRTEKRN